MIERQIIHETILEERSFSVPVARVVAAFADVEQGRRWDIPGGDWEVVELTQDFRFGGQETSRFGPKGDPRFSSVGVYLEIEPDARIISAGTMHENGKRMTCTLLSLEFRPEMQGSRLILTDQSAYFGAETSQQRRSGWGQGLDNLERFLAVKGATV